MGRWSSVECINIFSPYHDIQYRSGGVIHYNLLVYISSSSAYLCMAPTNMCKFSIPHLQLQSFHGIILFTHTSAPPVFCGSHNIGVVTIHIPIFSSVTHHIITQKFPITFPISFHSQNTPYTWNPRYCRALGEEVKYEVQHLNFESASNIDNKFSVSFSPITQTITISLTIFKYIY